VDAQPLVYPWDYDDDDDDDTQPAPAGVAPSHAALHDEIAKLSRTVDRLSSVVEGMHKAVHDTLPRQLRDVEQRLSAPRAAEGACCSSCWPWD
jgi:hypothetical protein